MRQYGHMTRQECDQLGLFMLKTLDAVIHAAAGMHYEPLRKYVRAERDPLTSSVLAVCRKFHVTLEAVFFFQGTLAEYNQMQEDIDVRLFCINLRDKLHFSHKNDWKKFLDDLDISQVKLDQWTRGDFNSPRFGQLIKLAHNLGYQVQFFDTINHRPIVKISPDEEIV